MSGAFSGKSTMLIGCGTSDTSGGTKIELEAGDVIVLPAGTAHCNLESTEDYKYIGVYPKLRKITTTSHNVRSSSDAGCSTLAERDWKARSRS